MAPNLEQKVKISNYHLSNSCIQFRAVVGPLKCHDHCQTNWFYLLSLVVGRKSQLTCMNNRSRSIVLSATGSRENSPLSLDFCLQSRKRHLQNFNVDVCVCARVCVSRCVSLLLPLLSYKSQAYLGVIGSGGSGLVVAWYMLLQVQQSS